MMEAFVYNFFGLVCFALACFFIWGAYDELVNRRIKGKVEATIFSLCAALMLLAFHICLNVTEESLEVINKDVLEYKIDNLKYQLEQLESKR